MRVAVLGATGFIGRHLISALQSRGDDAVAVSLRDPGVAAAVSSECDAIVNLAGEPVAQRWTDESKALIRSSRVDAPRAFLAELRSSEARPKTYVSASAIGYYGTSETATFTESSPPGNDFLARVCVEWEAVAQSAADLGMRVAILRTGIALGADGGALERILPPFKMGAGGRVASGRQWYSWIHVDDVVALYLHALDGASGVYNATAPEPVTNNEFTKQLAKAVRKPAFLPAPMMAIKALLGEGASVVAEGQRVVPQRALAEGFAFRYPSLAPALDSIVNLRV